MFKLTSQFEPTGDQPEAIKELTQGLLDEVPGQVLLGVTGSGKTFTIANVIQEVQPQQDAGRPIIRGVQGILPRKCGGIFRILLRLLPTGSLLAHHQHVYRERSYDQR